jgi:tetratricopeptide (TPR) repeat protein
MEDKDFARIKAQLARWLTAGTEPDEVAGLVHRLKRSATSMQWDSIGAAFAKPTVIAALIARSHALLGADPAKSELFSYLAVQLAFYLETPGDAFAVKGDAFREYASALFAIGDFKRASEACDEAAFAYASATDNRKKELSILALTRGQALHFLGQSEKGLKLIAAAAEELRSVDKKKYVEARVIYASILLSRQEVERALEVFEATGSDARQQNDTETLAYVVNNVGLCYVALGDIDKAKACFHQAMRTFDAAGLTAEVPRVRGGLIRILIREGSYNEAISELFKCRADFLQLRMPLVAASVALRLVEVLFLAGRHSQVPSLCAEIVQTFTDVGLHREASKALSYLTERRRIEPQDVEFVKAFVERLEKSGDEKFHRPLDIM